MGGTGDSSAVRSTARRRGEVKARLQQAMLELIRTQPFGELRIESIAEAAGLSRSAFYFYYGDKYELLMEAAGEAAEALYGQADLWWHGEGEPAELIRRGLSGVAGLWAENRELLAIAVEVSTYEAQVRDFWRALVTRFVDATAAHIRREQGAGRIDAALDAAGTAETLIWGAERSLYIFVATGDRSPEEIVESLTATWLRALYGEVAETGG